MRLMISVTCLVLGVAIVAENSASSAAQGGDPKYTISDVMKKAHGKNGILKKVTGGTATEAETKELLAMYTSMTKAKAPKGDEKSWKTKTDALVEGAKLVVDGKKDEGIAKLNTASKCADCHKAHKG